VPGTFIDVEVDATAGADPELARKLSEVCPVDIFRAGDSGVEIVQDNLDECVLCELCIRAAIRDWIAAATARSNASRSVK